MAKRENACRQWPIAVTASVFLHGAILLGLSLIPARAVFEAGEVSKSQTIPFTVVEYETGEITFEGPSEPAGSPRSSDQLVKRTAPLSDNATAWTATLKDPLDIAQGKEISPGAPISAIGGNGLLNEATTSLFQIATRGRKVLYVLDTSGSMGKNRALATACGELKESLKQLPGTARFQVMLYSNTTQYLLPTFEKWLEPTPAMVDAACAALDKLVPEGSTKHTDALAKAFLLRPEVVFLITDADDLKPEHVRLVKARNLGRAVVNTIELNIHNRERADMPLQVLARENRGVYRAVDLEH